MRNEIHSAAEIGVDEERTLWSGLTKIMKITLVGRSVERVLRLF